MIKRRHYVQLLGLPLPIILPRTLCKILIFVLPYVLPMYLPEHDPVLPRFTYLHHVAQFLIHLPPNCLPVAFYVDSVPLGLSEPLRRGADLDDIVGVEIVCLVRVSSWELRGQI